jgi:hypothetical protein
MIPVVARDSRQTLIAAAKAYFDALDCADSHLFRVQSGSLRTVTNCGFATPTPAAGR